MRAKRRKSFVIIILITFTVVFFIIRICLYTPTGAIRYECLLQGNVFSALFLRAKEIRTVTDGNIKVYKVTFAVPDEKATATHLDIWYITKNENGTYSATYGGG
jgi:hypothetical protein